MDNKNIKTIKNLPVPEPVPGDEPDDLILVVCDCEHPHFVRSQISCRGLNGENATGIYAK